jgi:hypothetical protein
MKLYRIKLTPETPSYRVKTYQLTADNVENAITRAVDRLHQDGLTFKKVVGVDIYLERGKAWLSKLNWSNQ